MAFKAAKPLKCLILIVTLFHLADLSCAYRFMPSTSSYASYEKNHEEELMVPPQTNRIIGVKEESTLHHSLSEDSPFYVPQDNAPVRATTSSYSASAPTSLAVGGKDSNDNEYIINWMSKQWPWRMVVSLITLILSGIIGIKVICHCYLCPSKRRHDQDQAQTQASPAANAPHGPTEELQLSIRVSNGPDDDDEKPLPDWIFSHGVEGETEKVA